MDYVIYTCMNMHIYLYGTKVIRDHEFGKWG